MCCRSAPLGEDEGICIRLPARTYTHAEPTHTYARLCFRSLLDRIMLGARCAGCRCRDCVRVCFRTEQSPKRLLFNRHASAQALRQTHTRTMYIRSYTTAHMLFDIHIRLGARAHMLKCCVVRMQSGLRDAQLERSPIQTFFRIVTAWSAVRFRAARSKKGVPFMTNTEAHHIRDNEKMV